MRLNRFVGEIIQNGPSIIWAKINHRIKFIGGKVKAHLFGTEISISQFKYSLRPEVIDIEDFLTNFKTQRSSSFFIEVHSKEEIIAALHLVNPNAEESILRAANRICDHRFDLLGSGTVDLGWPIDWHTDFKSGYRWNPRLYFADIHPASYPGGYDLKVPWELSRCQHFTWLGQAYWLSGDEKYAREFRVEVEDWIKQNPPEFGVNWACSMDIAIRAVNWLWGYAFFRNSPILDDDFSILFCKSLLSHGRHIKNNLERTSTFTGNHYLSDIVGLIYLGILLPEFKEAHVWRDFGLRELEREMFKQVYSDGGNFEASTSYHRLVTELFLSAVLLARKNGYSFSAEFMDRLSKMLEFIYQIIKPDGTVPIIGDQDNGRLHRLKIWEDTAKEWIDFRSLLAIGSILFDRFDWAQAVGNQWEEAIWFYGKFTLANYKKRIKGANKNLASTRFDDFGLYIMRTDDMFVAVDLGPIGQNGIGGHAHNDALSFELYAVGQTWIQDPGTYVYTSDYEARNFFRSTASHNTVYFPPHEQNDIDVKSPFSMTCRSRSLLAGWYSQFELGAYLAGELQYINEFGLTHTRSFFLDWKEHALVITDSIIGNVKVFQALFHFAPGITTELIRQPYPGMKLTNPDNKSIWLFSVSSGDTGLRISDGWISESYGVRKASAVALIEFERMKNKIVIMLQNEEGDARNRIDCALNNEKIFLERQ